MRRRVRGEFELIAAIGRRAGRAGARWPVAIGDDAALLRPRAGHDVAITTDALIEGEHFRWTTTGPRDLGHKALAVNLSDLNAMGARPLGCLLSLGLPRDCDPVRVDGLVAGLLDEGRAAGCPLVGGDTVASPVWMLSVTAFGEVARGRALTRAGAQPGDRVLVTGRLGGAALGLALLESSGAGAAAARPFVRRHVRPRPPLGVGPRLAGMPGITAAIDISDGLAQDAGHVAQESGVAIDLRLERLPLARGLRARCEALGRDPLELAVWGGEEYELVFCARPRAPSAASLSRRLGVEVTEIGAARRGRGVRTLMNGRDTPIAGSGWDHFKAPGKAAEE